MVITIRMQQDGQIHLNELKCSHLQVDKKPGHFTGRMDAVCIMQSTMLQAKQSNVVVGLRPIWPLCPSNKMGLSKTKIIIINVTGWVGSQI